MLNVRALLLASFAVCSLAGCVVSKNETEPTSGAGAGAPAASARFAVKSEGERLRIAVVPKGLTHQFWKTVEAGARAAGEEVNAEILWNGPKRETDIQEQIDIVNAYVDQGIDGMVLAATDKQVLAKTVEDLQGKGIPVVTIDSGVEPDVSQSFIATDNAAAAKKAAQHLGDLLQGRGKVAVLSFKKGASTSDEREQGFLEGIKAFPGIEVVAVEYTDSDSPKAMDKMESILSRHPDLAGVFAANEPNVVGAAGVLKTRKLAGKVKLVGFDASEPELADLRAGVVQALVVQNPFAMGYEGVKATARLLRGQSPPEKRVDTGATVVTQDNLEDAEIKKLLNPLAE